MTHKHVRDTLVNKVTSRMAPVKLFIYISFYRFCVFRFVVVLSH